MYIIEFCNNNIGFMSAILSTGLLFCAIAQWQSSNTHRNIELNRLKINHADDFIENWNTLSFYIQYIENYKAKMNIPKDYKETYYKFFRFLEKHTEYTKCYYGKSLYDKEKEFIKKLKDILPPDYCEEYIWNFEISQFDNVYNLYQCLCGCFIGIGGIK